MSTKSLAVLAVALLLVAAVAPTVATDGDLAVSVAQDDGNVTVSVEHDETAVENASVVVSVNATDDNATYEGAGDYSTDENGTVDLPAPAENVTIDVLAEYENETATTTAELVVAGEDETVEVGPFGARVSAYVRNLLGDGLGIGQDLAEWVVENNPGNAPDHAGASGDDGDVTGAGAPDDPGKSGERGNGNGPPEDRGSNGNGAAKGPSK